MSRDRRACGRSSRASPCRGSGRARAARRAGRAPGSRAAWAPICIAAGRDARDRLAVLLEATRCRRSRTRTGGRARVRSGSTRTRPARSSGTPSERASGDARTPAAQTTVRAARRSPPTSTRRRVDAGHRRAGPDLHAERLELRLRLAREVLRVGRAARAGPPRSAPRAPLRGSMRRKSRASEWRAISAKAPASSTPVGPPPITTKVSHCRRGLGVVLALGLLEGEERAPPDLERVLDRLEPGRVRLPGVVAEVGVASRRPRGSGSRSRAPSGIEPHALRRRIDRRDVAEQHAHVRLAAQDAADRRGDLGRRQPRGGHLVEQRLEHVVVLAVDERHVDRGPRQGLAPPRARRSRRRRSRPGVGPPSSGILSGAWVAPGARCAGRGRQLDSLDDRGRLWWRRARESGSWRLSSCAPPRRPSRDCCWRGTTASRVPWPP